MASSKILIGLLLIVTTVGIGCSTRRPSCVVTPAPTVEVDYSDATAVRAALVAAEGEAQRLRAAADELTRQARESTVRMWQRIAWVGSAACGGLMALFVGLSVWQSGAGPWLRLATCAGAVGTTVLGLGVAIPTIAWVAPILVGIVLLAGGGWVVAGLVRQYRAARVGVAAVDAAIARIPQDQVGDLIAWLKQYQNDQGARQVIRAHIRSVRAGETATSPDSIVTI